MHQFEARKSARRCGILLLAGLLAACTASVRSLPDEAMLAEQRRAFVAENNAAYRADLDSMFARMELEAARAKDPSDASYDVLLVHGGGPGGAFTAGFLLGWGTVGDPDMTRPLFDMVTGSSSGALVAPFAFIGTEAAYESLRDLTLDPPFEFRPPSVFALWPGRSGITNTSSFRDGLATVFEPEFLAAIRGASDERRSLLISGSNIELGLGRFWDVGRQVSELDDVAARARARDIVMASAAMPVMFPPVEIDGNLYADGGVTANIFMGFDAAGLREVAGRWYAKHPDVPMPVVRVWVLMSRELFLEPAAVPLRYADIGRRSLSIMMEYDRFKSLVGIIYMLRELDREAGIRTELRYAMPPPDADFPVEMSSINDPEVAQRMLDLGFSLGADAGSWKQEIPDTFMLRQH